MRLLFIAMLLLAPVTAQTQQQTKPDKPQRPPATKQQPSEQTPKITAVQSLGSGSDKADADNGQTSTPVESKPFLSHGEMISTVIGILVLIVSCFGWWAVHRQANTMERTLRLQESTLRQWITADNWSIRVDDSNSIYIHCMADNPTTAPLCWNPWILQLEADIKG